MGIRRGISQIRNDHANHSENLLWSPGLGKSGRIFNNDHTRYLRYTWRTNQWKRKLKSKFHSAVSYPHIYYVDYNIKTFYKIIQQTINED